MARKRQSPKLVPEAENKDNKVVKSKNMTETPVNIIPSSVQILVIEIEESKITLKIK